MSEDRTERGYLLPHPDNIAFKDVVRIRETIEKVDEDITKRENEHNNLKSNFERFNSETLQSVDLINKNIKQIDEAGSTGNYQLKNDLERFRLETSERINSTTQQISDDILSKNSQLKSNCERFSLETSKKSTEQIMKEVNKRIKVENNAAPFLFGILSRYNDYYGIGSFTSELGQLHYDTTSADYMFQLLSGSNTYDYTYSSFYRPPQLYFMQGSNGKFTYREGFVREIHSVSQASYPYALIGVIFVKNTTNLDITTTLHYSGSSIWKRDEGFVYTDTYMAGAGLFVGTPDNINSRVISEVTWENIYSCEQNSTGLKNQSSITTPANKTIAILLYTSAYYHGKKSGFGSFFMHWGINSFHSNFLTTGLKIDIERTLKAWQCPGLDASHKIWN